MSVSDVQAAEYLKTAPDAGLHLEHVATALVPEELFQIRKAGINLAVFPRTPAIAH